MESLRDVKRVMEREIEKGSCPLQFEYLEFGEKPFQFIESEEKLNEVLSYLLRLGEYRGYTEHLVGNNVYMDLDMLCRKFSLSVPIPLWSVVKSSGKYNAIKIN